ncbi:unnamed protein product [Bursaphelenchus okinawaensis]|uniref:Protein FRA10AC1 n=1 Tax=Bursaphelenchus okinawaensis TaxID=465554 RepID=A0A811KMG8_9BILA|nr:unnamed protein product [Bursaphelenchus okinawaensis]CAG9105261.1 unnamed protein product [Bursaphelenchus okinawaensis]
MKRMLNEGNPYLPEISKVRKKDEDGQKQIKRFKKNFVSLDAYTRHKLMVNSYLLCYKGASGQLERDSSKDRGIYDIIKENHRFLWGNEDLTDVAKDWDKQLAKKYYDKLYKEYCIADLSRFEKNQIGLRWRTEKEVVSGKGQFQCGGKHCEKKKKLTSWEVNFSYEEHGEKKNALVKVRLCPECSLKLNFHSKKRKIKKEKVKKKKHKKHKKKKRRHSDSEDSDSDVNDMPGTSSSDIKVEIQQDADKTEEEKKKEAEKEAQDIWSKPVDVNEEEATGHDEMESFFDDLLL